MRRRLIVALIAGLAGCSEPIDIVVLEPEVRSSTGISLGTMSFFFPVGLTFDGTMYAQVSAFAVFGAGAFAAMRWAERGSEQDERKSD